MKRFQIDKLEERIAPARAIVTCDVNADGEVVHTVTTGNGKVHTHVMVDETECPPGLHSSASGA